MIFSCKDGEVGRTASFADNGEILDGIITRSRGEIRRMCSFKVTSTTAPPSKEFKRVQSLQIPRHTDMVYSPRVSELSPRLSELSPRLGARSPRTGEVRQSNLGKSG